METGTNAQYFKRQMIFHTNEVQECPDLAVVSYHLLVRNSEEAETGGWQAQVDCMFSPVTTGYVCNPNTDRHRDKKIDGYPKLVSQTA